MILVTQSLCVTCVIFQLFFSTGDQEVQQHHYTKGDPPISNSGSEKAGLKEPPSIDWSRCPRRGSGNHRWWVLDNQQRIIRSNTSWHCWNIMGRNSSIMLHYYELTINAGLRFWSRDCQRWTLWVDVIHSVIHSDSTQFYTSSISSNQERPGKNKNIPTRTSQKERAIANILWHIRKTSHAKILELWSIDIAMPCICIANKRKQH